MEAAIESLRDAESWLEGLIDHERRRDFDYATLGARRVEALLEALGRPQRGLPCVHVAGSKGKGVTTLAAEHLLRAAGLRAGAFTSPHLETWCERFHIDGVPVSEAELVDTLAEMRPAVEKLRCDPRLRPSFFDVSTALALLLFRRAALDAAAVEVGLGGRLDSTRCVEPRVSVITSIQLEHVDKLGATRTAIAGEKAGIVCPGVPVICGQLPPRAEAVVRIHAARRGAPFALARARDVELDARGIRFRTDDGRKVRSPLLGAHQAGNLALAIAAVERFVGRKLASAELDALADLNVPARIERIGDVVLDCAHSPDSIRALTATLEAIWPGRSWCAVLSVSRDKDLEQLVAELPQGLRYCVATTSEALRSLPPRELAAALNRAGCGEVECEQDPHTALTRVLQGVRPGEGVLVTGSVYLAGAVRGALRDLAAQTAARRPAGPQLANQEGG